jgi:CheY-like chemotaxis protein
MMPRRNGYQVCRTLKMDPRLRDIPVIFLTAKDQKEDRFWGKDCGADEYVTKPFSAAKLERVIERLLDERDRKMQPGGDAEARYEQWKGASVPCAIATYRLDGKALTVFRQKYGEMKYGEVLEGVRERIEVVLREEVSDFVIERGGDGVFRVVMPCDPDAAESLSHRVCAQCDLLLRSFYIKEDVERGYIVSRAGATGGEIHVPLMALERSLALDGAAVN